MAEYRIGVIGGGLMGSGIAEVCARHGCDTTVMEPSQDRLQAAQHRLVRSLGHALERRKLTQPQIAEIREKVHFTTRMRDLGQCDIVVEAVPESLELKREVFAELDEICRPDTILASNTSSIPLAELGSATARPDRVLGLHFFSPVPVMKLVELVRALRSSAETVERGRAFGQYLGKQVIETKDRAGFIVNMLLIPYMVAAVRMYEEGFATRDDIDTGMILGCNHPMGPLQLVDFIGLDVTYEVCNSLFEEFKDRAYAPPPLLKRMLAAGLLGRKSGAGFYEYPAQS